MHLMISIVCIAAALVLDKGKAGSGWSVDELPKVHGIEEEAEEEYERCLQST